MLIAAVCLQASLLAHPLYLQEEKPELRSAQHIFLMHEEVEGLPFRHERTKEEALALMHQLVERVEAGEDFGELALQHSEARTRAWRGSLGSFPSGQLKEPVDGFLFDAELGEVSPVFDTPDGLHLIKRVETFAAIQQIQLEGTGEETMARARALLAQLDEGADFGELAESHSKDPISSANRGRYRVFERGSRDSSIKAAAFQAAMGELVGPIESPLGVHLIKRVPSEDFPPELWEDNFIRVRAVLIAHLEALNSDPNLSRTQSEAMALGEELVRRLEQGEDLAEVAARFNDDPGGKERAGDLGWIHRQNPDLPRFYTKLFLGESGQVHGPILTTAGVVVARRED